MIQQDNFIPVHCKVSFKNPYRFLVFMYTGKRQGIMKLAVHMYNNKQYLKKYWILNAGPYLVFEALEPFHSSLNTKKSL